MSWYRKVFVWGLLLGGSASASAQTLENRSFVRIAQPASAVVATTPGSAAPAPTKVVRGAMAHFEDDKANAGARPLTPMLPMLPMLPAQAVEPKTNVIEVDKQGKVTVIPEPPSFQKINAKTPAVSAQPIVASPKAAQPIVIGQQPANMTFDDRVIVVDEAGNPIFENAFNQRPLQFYAQAEYLLWWTRGMNLPPLVTTSPVTTPQANVGVLGLPTTSLLFGNTTTSSGPQSGARFLVGYSLDPCNWCMVEVGGFFLTPNRDGFAVNSNQFPNIARPFFDINDGIPNRELTTAPNLGIPGNAAGTGGLTIDTSTTLWGLEANVRSMLWCGCNWDVSGIVGFRYLQLNDNLDIIENTLVQVGFAVNPGVGEVPVVAGSFVTVADHFSTRNRFYGGQIGGTLNYQLDNRWSLVGNVKLGFGVTQQIVDINGSQQIVPPAGPPVNFVGGLYAVGSNIGRHSQNQFGFVPEVGLKLNYQLTENISVFAGYDFLYWSSVVRAGDQIDQVLDLNQVPQSGKPYPPAPQVRPVVPFQTSSFWAHGVNAGVMFRY